MLGLIVLCPDAGGGVSPAATLEPLLAAPLLARSIAASLPTSTAVTGVVSVSDQSLVERVQTEVVKAFAFDEIDAVVFGGPSRRASLKAALAALPDAVSEVLVTEGARPCVPLGLVDKMIQARGDKDGVVLVLRASDDQLVYVDGRLQETTEPALVSLQGPYLMRRDALAAILSERETAHELVAALPVITVAVLDGDKDNLLVCDASDSSRAVEVFARRALEYAFIYPEGLLPDDAVAAMLADDASSPPTSDAES